MCCLCQRQIICPSHSDVLSLSTSIDMPVSQRRCVVYVNVKLYVRLTAAMCCLFQRQTICPSHSNVLSMSTSNYMPVSQQCVVYVNVNLYVYNNVFYFSSSKLELKYSDTSCPSSKTRLIQTTKITFYINALSISASDVNHHDITRVLLNVVLNIQILVACSRYVRISTANLFYFIFKI